MTRPLEIFFCNWADLTRVDNNRPNWQQPVFVIPGSAIRAIGGIQHSPLFLEGNSSSFQAFVAESWVYMERNWSKQVGPCNNRPFDEQTFKTISHLTRRLTVPVVSIAPFCQVLQILFHPFVSHHLFFSGAGPAQGTFLTTQLLLLFSLHFVKGNVWGSISQERKISSQVFAFNNFVLLCRDCFCSRVSSLPLSCVQVNLVSLQVNVGWGSYNQKYK